MANKVLSALLASLAVLLAGCTSAPPPATPPAGGPTGVSLSALDPSALPGANVRFAWEVQGGTENITHSELHSGPSQVSDPTQGVYANTAPGNAESGGRYTATIQMPLQGLIYARAHVQAGSKNLWSSEVTVRPAAQTLTFSNVQVPGEVEAGVPFTLSYRVEGAGSTNHVGAHFSHASSAGLATHFKPSEWEGLRTSQHLGSPAVTFPADIRVNATVPWPGTWYLRPHALLGTENWWGSEVTITALNPGTPNIVLLSAPTNTTAGVPLNLTYQLNAQPGTSNHVGAHYSQQSASLGASDAPTAWPGQRAAPHHGLVNAVSIPGQFNVSINFPLPGTWYYRAHAIVASTQTWSVEVPVTVAPPATPKVFLIDPPRNYTVTLNPTDARVNTISVEWAVVSTNATTTNHTDLHHGPASVASPSEPGTATQRYPQQSAAQNGTLPGLFQANVTIAPGPGNAYYLRAMAVVHDGTSPNAQVWSDEWVIAVQVKTV